MRFSLSPNQKILLDFAPLAVFFLAYRLSGVMAATLALLAATLFGLALTYWAERKIALAPLITAGVVAVFGGLTLWLKDETFIKMKPTIVNGLFGAVLLGGVWIGKRGLLKPVLGVAFSLTEEGWRVLSLRWGVFFWCLAGLNEVIWRHFSTDFWVNFKVFGMLTVTLCFSLSQLRALRRYAA
jgi:intracellular septation protein